MGHTNKTTNYELPQFLATDKPAWLTDINTAFLDIDTGMKNNAVTAGQGRSEAAEALTRANEGVAAAAAAQATADANTVSIGNVDSQLKANFTAAGMTANVNPSRSNTFQVYQNNYTGSIKLNYATKPLNECSSIKIAGTEDGYVIPMFTINNNIFKQTNISDGSKYEFQFFLGNSFGQTMTTATNFKMHALYWISWWTGSITYVGFRWYGDPSAVNTEELGAGVLCVVYTGGVTPTTGY